MKGVTHTCLCPSTMSALLGETSPISQPIERVHIERRSLCNRVSSGSVVTKSWSVLHPQVERQVWGLKPGECSGGRWDGSPAGL